MKSPIAASASDVVAGRDLAAADGTRDAEVEALAALLPLSAQIDHFLAGRTDGQVLLEALYDDVLDEPVPSRLTDVLRAAG